MGSFSVGVVLAGWPGRGGRQRWSAKQASEGAAPGHVVLDLENVPTELVSPTRAANICPRAPRNLADPWTPPQAASQDEPARVGSNFLIAPHRI